MSIFRRTFKGGIHPPENKETSGFKIERLPQPQFLYIHLLGSFGSPSEPVVEKGQRVLKGEVIAKPTSKISSFIHSPVSGIISDIKNWPHYSGKSLPAIVIENDFKNEEFHYPEKNIPLMRPSDIVSEVRNFGIVGLGGAVFPTDVKLSPPVGKKITTIIVNGCECEPYLTCDESVIREEPEKIIEGAVLAARATSAKEIIIAIEKNKTSSARKLVEIAGSRAKIVFLPVKYPQGGEKQLIYAVLRRKVLRGALPADVGCVVINVQTAKAIYEAICKRKPLYERVTTLGGFFRKPGNVIAPIGITLKDLIEFRGGLPDNVDKIIFGGPMMGVSVDNLDVPLTKATSGILLFTHREKKLYECIRCMRCRDVCPMNLSPRESYALFKRGEAYSYADICIECGSCAYACPAGIPLVQYLKWAKQKLKSVRSAAGK